MKNNLKDISEIIRETKNRHDFPLGSEDDIADKSSLPYFTMCPNTLLSEVIASKGTPYREDEDKYHREPYSADVSVGKGHAIYNAHTYHTKVPHKAITPFIKHYTNEGDIVLDAFCGTGMTGVAAQELNRLAILSDLSPMAAQIAFSYNNPVKSEDFLNTTNAILKDVKNRLGWVYETYDADNKTKGIINYTVWSDVYISPFSGNEFVFHDVAIDEVTGKVKSTFKCPDTGADLTKKECERAFEVIYDPYLQKEIKVAKQVPVLINYTVVEIKNGKRKSVSKFKPLDEHDNEIISKVNSTSIAEWFPTNRMMEGREARRNDKNGITHIHHFFFKRTIILLSEIYAQCTTPILKVWFTSQIVNLSKLNRYRPGISFPYNPLSGTLYIGSQVSESNVFTAYENKQKKFLKAIPTIKKANYVSVCSATDLTIPSNSIDYVFTDPPFGDNLMYSELNFIWESWLRIRTNIEQEGIINKSQNKSLREYNTLMLGSFKEYYRVLKPKRWITVVFHNSKSSVWNGIQEAITKAGFIISQVSTLDKKLGSFKQVTAPGSVANDLVISAFKPSKSFSESFISQAGEGLEVTFLNEFLSNLPSKPIIERTEKMLYSKMVAYYIQRGYEIRYDAKSFYSLLQSNFIEEDGFWFTSDQINSYIEYKKYAKLNEIEEIKSGGLFLFVTDEKSALVWLHNFLNQPKSFSDISVAFNQLANIQDDQVPELRDLLEENFVFEGGLYRRPKSEEEHNQITEKRQKQLWKQFESILIQAQTERKKIKEVRKEALTYGFERCYKDKRFKDILTIASKLHPSILENNGELADFVEAAEIQTEGLA